MRVPVLVTVLASGLLTAGCGEPDRPHLLILVSDGLRADALSCYGGEARTPHLCGLAERGVLFERAFANAPWTLPSAVVLLTGRPAGWYRRTSDRQDTASHVPFYRVPGEERLLGEALGERGYRVEAWIENPVARRRSVLQGFTLRGPGSQEPAREPKELDPRIRFRGRDGRYHRIRWLLELLSDPPGEPVAALHWIDDPHAPYRPPPGLEPEVVPAGLPRHRVYYTNLGHRHRPESGRRNLRRVAPGLTREEIAFVRHLYLREVESLDERVGYVLRALELSGLSERTLVVFTSDHGEAFGEHGDFLHGGSLYDELLRVPLILAGPGIEAGHRVPTPVSHLDLVPTLADLLGLEGLGPFPGRSLRVHLEGRAEVRNRFHYLSSPGRLDRDGVVWGRYKLLAGYGEETDDIELYDYVADRQELRNGARELPEVRGRLLEALLRFRREEERRWRARAEGEPTAAAEERRETERALRAVGYLD